MNRSALMLLAALSLAAPARGEVRTLSRSAAPGPTLLIVDDPAADDYGSAVALQQIGCWPLTKGRIMTAAAAEVPSAVASTGATAVVVLHTERSKSAGTVQTRGMDAAAVVADLNADADPAAERIVIAGDPAAAAAAVADAAKSPPPIKAVDDPGDGPPVQPAAATRPAAARPATGTTGVAGALGRAVVDAVPPGGQFARVSLVIKPHGTVPASRSRLFRQAVYDVLMADGMLAPNAQPWQLIDHKPGRLTVAFYAGLGSDSSPGPRTFPRIFNDDPGVGFTYVGPAELTHPGLLKQFDVLFFCGGMGNSQGHAIGPAGADAVRAFVHGGGGYVSTCAGSYLASTGFGWSLGLINAKVVDYKHWNRGMGDVDVELTDAGRQILGDYPGLFALHYANGPMLAPADAAGLPPFTPLAYFRSDMAKTAPGGVMPNTPAIVASTYGDGRVLCFSPHPEYTSGLEGFIGRAVRWAAKRPVTDAAAK